MTNLRCSLIICYLISISSLQSAHSFLNKNKNKNCGLTCKVFYFSGETVAMHGRECGGATNAMLKFL